MVAVGLSELRTHGLKALLALGLVTAASTALVQLSAGPGAAVVASALDARETSATEAQALAAYGDLPLSFVPNSGQADAAVRFQAETRAASFYFTPTEAVLMLAGAQQGHVLRLRFVGGSADAEIVGESPAGGRVNYLLGSDPARWRTGLPTFGEVVYRDLWPGIDLAFRGERGTLKYEFRVAAGADPSRIRLAYRGADSVGLDRSGNLLVGTSLGTLSDSRPVSYQQAGRARVPVASRYTVSGSSYGFALGAYDRSRPLVVDPGLVYSTYIGAFAGDMDIGWSIAVDAGGNAYVAGETGVSGSSAVSRFPTTAGAFDTTYNGNQDAFVTKLDPTGSALVYSTYLGGSSFDFAKGIAVDAAGSAWVIGRTASPNFPLSVNAQDGSLGGLSDAFVTKLDPTGSALVYSSYLGGGSIDEGRSIAVDGSGDAYLTGFTGSADFPTTLGAFDRVLSGGDAFIAKLDPTGAALRYSTFVGGTALEQGYGIAVDAAGNAHVTGRTMSTNLPTTDGAFDRTYNGGDDVFVTTLDPTGSALVYSTYLGGSGQDIAWGIAVDAAGSPYVAGQTTSANFPVTGGAFDGTLTGIQDAFVAKVSISSSSLAYASYLGGNSGTFAERAFGIAVDAEGNAHVTGVTPAADFPITPGAVIDTHGPSNVDVFVTKVDGLGSMLLYSTFLSSATVGSGAIGNAIAVDRAGRTYVTGGAAPSALATTSGSFRPSGAGAFVTKLDTGSPPPPVPATVTLTPPTDTNPVGTSHTVTAEVLDADGHTMESILVRFEVSGSVTASGQCTTGAAGTCSFAYQGPDYPGADLIVAFADTDEDGVRDEDEPAAEATKSWLLPDSTPGKASGGGNIEVGGNRIAFGFSASGVDKTKAKCQVIDRAADVVVECVDVFAFVIADNTVTVWGSALVNGIPTTFRIDAADNARRGKGADTFSIQTDSGYSRSGLLVGGSVRVD